VQSRNIGWFQNPFGSNVKDVPSKHKMELNYMNFNGVLKDNCNRRKFDELLYVSTTTGTLAPNFKLGFCLFQCLLQLASFGEGRKQTRPE
jgi:hypothetical protein